MLRFIIFVAVLLFIFNARADTEKRPAKAPPARITIPSYVPPLPLPPYFRPQGKNYRLCLQPGECP